jgi:hypothetical protein
MQSSAITTQEDLMEATISDYREGQRVQLAPHLDLWMCGARYGTVVKVGRLYVHVLIDITGQTVKVGPMDIFEVIS